MAVEYQRIFKDWFKVGLLTGLLTTLVALVIGWLKLPLVNLTFSAFDVNVRQQATQGISTDLGAKMLGYLSGLGGFKFPTLIVTLISALLIVYLGRIIYEWMPFKAKTPVGKLTMVLFEGSLVAGLLASFTLAIPAFGVLAAMLIYFVVISFLLWLLSEKANLFRLPE